MSKMLSIRSMLEILYYNPIISSSYFLTKFVRNIIWILFKQKIRKYVGFIVYCNRSYWPSCFCGRKRWNAGNIFTEFWLCNRIFGTNFLCKIQRPQPVTIKPFYYVHGVITYNLRFWCDIHGNIFQII